MRQKLVSLPGDPRPSERVGGGVRPTPSSSHACDVSRYGGVQTTGMMTRRQARDCLIAAVAFGALVVTGVHAQALRIGTPAPDLAGGPWINSAPLTIETLRGRVVLVDFWTYG